MRSHTVLTLCAIAFAGCGEEPELLPPDAPPPDGTIVDEFPDECEPFAPLGEQGCLVGQKCTWIRVDDEPPLGKLGCVPDGVAPLGAACMVGPLGETTGYDNCMAGLYCIDEVCEDVCGFDGDADAACPSGYNCTRYANTFANGDDAPVAGICNPGCDPLTQTKLGTNPPAGCGEDKGCYLLVSQTTTIAVCASAGDVAHGAHIAGQWFANSCVPGAQPRQSGGPNPTIECGGLCRMVDVYEGMNDDLTTESGQVTASTSDKDNCVATWGAAPPNDATNGESCRYWWAREPFNSLSPYSNSVGWCFKHSAFRYDSNFDMTPDRAFPRCASLTTGDVEPPIFDPPHNDALSFWCVAAPPPMLQGAIRTIQAQHARLQPALDRLVDHSAGAR